MIYYLKRNLVIREYLIRKIVESILFLSQLFNWTKTSYWPIELELAGIVWVLHKIRYMIEFSKYLTLIFTDHGMILGIVK